MPADPVASVLVCTRNRATHLRGSLATVLQAAEGTSIPTEVVVVDNGSSDETPGVLAELQLAHPALVIVRYDVPGLSGARNHGVGWLRGEVVLLTDDDVLVPPSWVDDMAGPILDGRADAVAGKVRLAPSLDRPWLTPVLRVPLAELLEVSGPSPGMVGANTAVALAVVRELGFDEELGAGALGFAEDVLFNLRLKSRWYRLVGSDGPAVVHNLDPDRLSHEVMVDLAHRNGRSHAYLWHHWLHSKIRWLWLRWLRDTLKLVGFRLRHGRRQEGIEFVEYDLVFRRSLYLNLMIERRRPPRYPVSS